jgi:ParB-like chromosome segregation protein Spo0J
VSKKKHLPDFDPFVGEGDSSPISIDGAHAPMSVTDADAPEATVVSEYKLENIIPDFFQSRGGVLPRRITVRLGEGEIDQRKALGDWRKLTTRDEAQKRRYDELVRLKESIRQNGLINPVHITRSADGDGFVLLCGERRYWAYWLLNEELDGYNRIPAILHSDSLRFLQIAENEDVEPLSTVSRARQTALAYLELLGIRPPEGPEPEAAHYWSFFRNALKPTEELLGTTYRPRGFWKDLSERLGLHRTSIIKIMEILQLPDPALDLADLWNVSQRQLEAILAGPKEIQQELVDATIMLQLSSSDLTELVQIANEYGQDEYNKALDYFRTEKVILKPSGKRKRIQRSPEERYFMRIVKTVEGVSKYTQGDYGQIARLIVGNRPEKAAAYAEELTSLAKAIKEEIKKE